MEQLKRFRVPVLTGVGTLIVALVLYAVWISPEGSHLAKLQAQKTELQTQQTSLQLRIATLKREKTQFGASCQQLTTDLNEIPGTPNVDVFLQQVTHLAVTSGDPNTPSISVTEATGAATGVTPIGVSLTLSGTYGQMTSFLEGLDTFPRLFTVTGITVTGGAIATGGQAVAPSATGYDLNMSGDIFYSTGQKNVCASPGAAVT
jgi:Tfp pilus assembly protein PilO